MQSRRSKSGGVLERGRYRFAFRAVRANLLILKARTGYGEVTNLWNSERTDHCCRSTGKDPQ